jgi:hypothetical protein
MKVISAIVGLLPEVQGKQEVVTTMVAEVREKSAQSISIWTKPSALFCSPLKRLF